MQRSQLLEVFAGGDHIAQFDPDQDMNVGDVPRRYRVCVLRDLPRQPGYNCSSAASSTTASRPEQAWPRSTGTRSFKYSEETFKAPHEDRLTRSPRRTTSTASTLTLDPATGNVRRHADAQEGRLPRSCIDPVAPEEFLIEPLATCISTRPTAVTARRRRRPS
jgi:hypothetical protein